MMETSLQLPQCEGPAIVDAASLSSHNNECILLTSIVCVYPKLDMLLLCAIELH